jgi:hypothetical protein
MFVRSRIGSKPVENLVEVKLLVSRESSRRPFGRFRDVDNRPLTSTKNSRYWFVKIC